MIDTLRKLYDLLNRRERIGLALLFVAVLVMAFLQLASIASVMPFLSLAADPSLVQTNAWFAWAYDFFGFTSTNRFLVALGLLALAALVVSNAWMAATQWAQFRFVRARAHGLSMKLLTHYLAQPYVWFLRRNSADLGKNILAEVSEVTGVLIAGLELSSRMIVALAIFGLLVALDPLLALLVTFVFGGAYGGIYLGVRRTLNRLGATRVKANTARYKAAGEAFGAIKDVKLLGKEQAFLGRFRAPSERINRVGATAQIIKTLPRYALETIAFGGVLIISITLLLRGDGLQEMIPIIGLYVFAGYRLMPSLQLIFGSLASLRFGAPAVDNLHRELVAAEAANSWRSGILLPSPEKEQGGSDWQSGEGSNAVPLSPGGSSAPLALTDRLELDCITFTYPGAHRPALQDITLTIHANTTVGVRGPTGSGKTTLVDIILGLLRPDNGTVRVDGVDLTDHNLRAWQAGVGYVPQHIYLSDDTIAANIAFGVRKKSIDMAAAAQAARLAKIHDFIAHELPKGYDTMVGERGIRLSGGQRQRIGIARALYHSPAVLVFDEATSALDDETEAAVMEAIATLAGTRTIIVIAHRLTTLKGCDEVYLVERGRVVTRDEAIPVLALAPFGST